MIQHISLRSMLRDTLSASYNDLVTRSTGAAVRQSIEETLPNREDACAILDFSDIGLVDHSCADEVVARLVLDRLHAARSQATCPFIFRGLSEAHCDAIEPVLDRHGLVIVAELHDGVLVLLGPVSDELRSAFESVTGTSALQGKERRDDAIQELLSRHLLPPEGWRHGHSG